MTEILRKGRKECLCAKEKNNFWPASTEFKIILSAGMKIKFGSLESILDLVECREENRNVDIQFELKNWKCIKFSS